MVGIACIRLMVVIGFRSLMVNLVRKEMMVVCIIWLVANVRVIVGIDRLRDWAGTWVQKAYGSRRDIGGVLFVKRCHFNPKSIRVVWLGVAPHS